MVVPQYSKQEPSFFRLTREDVEQLLQYPTTDIKLDVLEKVSSSFEPSKLTDKERELAEQIFRLLVQDASVRIREALSHQLKTNPHAPKDIILRLANDEEPVSSPVLEMSTVLDDDDLMEIIRGSDEIWRYVAVANREVVSETLADVLVDTDNLAVIYTLLDNTSVKFAAHTYDKLVEDASEDMVLASKLAHRPTLPLYVVEKLMAVVSDDLARQMEERFNIDREESAAHAHSAREMSTLDLIAQRSDIAQTSQLVRQLHRENRLTASLIINALCNGNIDFFELSMAVLSGIPLENAQKLIADRGPLGFRALYNKSGLPTTMFKAVRLLLDSVRLAIKDGLHAGSGRFANDVIEKMLGASETEPVENLSYILALLRQNARVSVI
jgi:uncharacterized protein (DUF2336 family)